MAFLITLVIAIGISTSMFADEPPPRNRANDAISFWLDRLPAESETLFVINERYAIPRQSDKSNANVFTENLLQRWFGETSRQVLEGNTLTCSIEAAWGFRFPDLPLELSDASFTGLTTEYDGCHVLIFDENAAPDWNALVASIKQDPECTTATLGKVLVCELRHHLRNRHRFAKETAELSQRIDQALATRYWMTMYSPHVLLIATRADILAKLQRDPTSPRYSPFPESLPQWQSIDQSFPVWGMRRPKNGQIPHSLGQIVPDSSDSTTGFAFMVDLHHGRWRLTFEDQDAASNERWKSLILTYLDKSTTCDLVPEMGLRASLSIDSKTREELENFRSGIAFWLLAMMGHPVMI